MCKDCKDEDPCCNRTGKCTAAKTDSTISMCICCGAEMLKWKDSWYHWSQFINDIPEYPDAYQWEER